MKSILFVRLELEVVAQAEVIFFLNIRSLRFYGKSTLDMHWRGGETQQHPCHRNDKQKRFIGPSNLETRENRSPCIGFLTRLRRKKTNFNDSFRKISKVQRFSKRRQLWEVCKINLKLHWGRNLILGKYGVQNSFKIMERENFGWGEYWCLGFHRGQAFWRSLNENYPTIRSWQSVDLKIDSKKIHIAQKDIPEGWSENLNAPRVNQVKIRREVPSSDFRIKRKWKKCLGLLTFPKNSIFLH